MSGSVVIKSNKTESIAETSATVLFEGSLDNVTITGNDNSVSVTGAADLHDEITVNGQGNAVSLADDGSAISVAANGTPTIGTGDTATISGSDNAVTLTGVGNIVSLTGASGNTIAVSGSGNFLETADSTITFYGGVQGWLTGGANTLDLAPYAQATVSGNNEVINELYGGDFVTLDGNGGTVTIGDWSDTTTIVGNSNLVALEGDGALLSIAGSLNTTNVTGIDETITLAGNSNTIIVPGSPTDISIDSLVTGGTPTVVDVSGQAQVIEANGITVAVAANSQLTLNGTDAATPAANYGNEDFITLGSADTLLLTGVDNWVGASSGDVVTLQGVNDGIDGSGTGNLVTVSSTQAYAVLSGSTLDLGPGASATLTGGGNAVNLAAGSDLTVWGSGNVIVGSGLGDSVTIDSGDNTIRMTGGTVTLAGGAQSGGTGFTDQGFAYDSYVDGEFQTPIAAQSLQQLAATGANTVMIDLTQYIQEPTDGSESGDVVAPTSQTESNASVITAIDNAEADGLTVFLRPQADASDYSGYLAPSNITAFFQSYDAFILNYATIAAENKVSLFSIGNEMPSLTGTAYEAYWDTLIGDVRGVFAQYGDTATQLTYCAAFQEAGSVSFWGSLNVISVNAYEALTTLADPTMAELEAGWTSTPNAATGNEAPVTFYQSLSAEYGEPLLFSELGYQSVNGTNQMTGDAPGPDDGQYQAQANALDAFLQTFSSYALSPGQSLSSSHFVLGSYLWEWNPNPANVTAGDFSVQGKPALNTVESWYGGSVTAAQTVTTVEGANTLVFSGTRADGSVVGLVSGSTASAVLGAFDTLAVSNGGTASATFVGSGGALIVSAGGSTTSSFVQLGGSEIVYGGGIADASLVSSGGVQVVVQSGMASGTVLSSGGFQYLSGGGIAADTIVENGSTQVVSWLTTAIRARLAGSGSASWLTSAIRTQLISGGRQIVSSGGVASSTMVSAGGVETVTSGGGIDGSVISSGGLVVVSSGAAVSGIVVMSGGTIDLASLSFHSGGSVSFNSATDVLTVTEDGISAALGLADKDPAEYFHLGSDGADGTLVTLSSVPCYCPGTLIMTPSGEVAIECLAIGDEVITLGGVTRPIKWIGERRYRAMFLDKGSNLWPVRIAAGALADDIPTRDLWVSPLHAIYLDGVLVPAIELVNGTTVVQICDVDDLHYIHLELDRHDIIFANGAAAESFLDDDTRGMFHNAVSYHVLYPDAAEGGARYCAPRITHGYELESIRQRLGLRAGTRQRVPAQPLRGYVDQVTVRQVRGWAQNSNRPDVPVCLDILVDGCVVSQTLADRYRAGLEAVTGDSGRHAFLVDLPAPFQPTQELVVRRSSDGLPLRSGRADRRAVGNPALTGWQH